VFGVVGQIVGQLDPAIGGAGMQDDHIRLGGFEFFVIEAVRFDVFFLARGKIESQPRTLVLDAQHDDGVCPADAEFEVFADFDVHVLIIVRHKVIGRGDAYLRAEFFKKVDVRSCHAAAREIAADGDRQAVELSFVPSDRHRIKEGLRRVRVRAVACVDDVRFDVFGEHLGSAFLGMAEDKRINVHGVQRHCRIKKGFAFCRRTLGNGHVDDIRAKPFGGNFKRRARAGRIFKEKINGGFAVKLADFLVFAAVLLGIKIGKIENSLYFRSRQGVCI